MQDLKELVQLGLSERVSKVETLRDLRKNKESLTARFLEGLAGGRYNTDDEAKEDLYGPGYKGSKYHMLKKRFREKIYTTLLFLQPRQKDKTSSSYYFYFCHKYFAVAKLLMFMNLTKAGLRLMKKVYKLAAYYNVFDVAAMSALQLRVQYMNDGEARLFHKYNLLFRRAHAIVSAEAEAQELYYSLLMKYSTSLAHKPWLAERAKIDAERIKELRDKYHTYQLHYADFNIRVLYNEFNNNYRPAVEACIEYEQYLLNTPRFYTYARHANLLLVQADAHLHLREYEQAGSCAERSMKFMVHVGTNWFSLLELYFLTAINLHNYNKAAEIYALAVGNASLTRLPHHKQEIWKVFSGYIWFLLKFEGKEELLRMHFPKKTNFRLSTLLNEIPIFAQDKKGFNISVLILQVLILLQEKDYVGIMQRTGALRNYVYKNLRSDEARRSHYFIRMLLYLEKADFNPKELEIKTRNLYAKLEKEAIKYGATQSRLEIIQYEELWKMTLNILEKNTKPQMGGIRVKNPAELDLEMA